MKEIMEIIVIFLICPQLPTLCSYLTLKLKEVGGNAQKRPAIASEFKRNEKHSSS